ncbi:uncharacterized protein KY384_003901 [Bacidia gigantensis]|uniref:uncharacterized protein n=1 Tax=Bacidia gigantensis TaxID=2732470 RepID=UPI001D03EA11|nr:uncharacterized protein KY384_003901 [Bacidia gigantensis]KAG8532260.1 hypothetical protein KY384_003901 [Bacidia gigantensis]
MSFEISPSTHLAGLRPALGRWQRFLKDKRESFYKDTSDKTKKEAEAEAGEAQEAGILETSCGTGVMIETPGSTEGTPEDLSSQAHVQSEATSPPSSMTFSEAELTTAVVNAIALNNTKWRQETVRLKVKHRQQMSQMRRKAARSRSMLAQRLYKRQSAQSSRGPIHEVAQLQMRLQEAEITKDEFEENVKELRETLEAAGYSYMILQRDVNELRRIIFPRALKIEMYHRKLYFRMFEEMDRQRAVTHEMYDYLRQTERFLKDKHLDARVRKRDEFTDVVDQIFAIKEDGEGLETEKKRWWGPERQIPELDTMSILFAQIRNESHPFPALIAQAKADVENEDAFQAVFQEFCTENPIETPPDTDAVSGEQPRSDGFGTYDEEAAGVDPNSSPQQQAPKKEEPTGFVISDEDIDELVQSERDTKSPGESSESEQGPTEVTAEMGASDSSSAPDLNGTDDSDTGPESGGALLATEEVDDQGKDGDDSENRAPASSFVSPGTSSHHENGAPASEITFTDPTHHHESRAPASEFTFRDTSHHYENRPVFPEFNFTQETSAEGGQGSGPYKFGSASAELTEASPAAGNTPFFFTAQKGTSNEEVVNPNDSNNGLGSENLEPPKTSRVPNPYVSDDCEDESETSEELQPSFTNIGEDVQVYELPCIDTSTIFETENLLDVVQEPGAFQSGCQTHTIPSIQTQGIFEPEKRSDPTCESIQWLCESIEKAFYPEPSPSEEKVPEVAEMAEFADSEVSASESLKTENTVSDPSMALPQNAGMEDITTNSTQSDPPAQGEHSKGSSLKTFKVPKTEEEKSRMRKVVKKTVRNLGRVWSA